MHAAEAAGREDPDARPRGQQRRGRHGRAAGHLPGHRDADVAAADLDHGLVRGDALELAGHQADLRYAVDERDRGRGHALAGQDGLELPGGVQVARTRQAVRDDRRLERDDRRTGLQRGADRRGHLYQGRHANDCLIGRSGPG